MKTINSRESSYSNNASTCNKSTACKNKTSRVAGFYHVNGLGEDEAKLYSMFRSFSSVAFLNRSPQVSWEQILLTFLAVACRDGFSGG